MTAMFLSRARLKAGMDRLGPIFFPNDPAARVAISHRLVWRLFPASLKDERPFLYRETASSHSSGRTARGEFLILSRLAPEDEEGLFELETQPFAPKIQAGAWLQFSLRANPTSQKSEMVNGKRKTRRHDVVMKSLQAVSKSERAAARARIIREAGLAWLGAQGARAGFSLPENTDGISVDGYEQFDVDPENRRTSKAGHGGNHSRLDFEGLLKVEDPARFIEGVASGFGRARAFGHGLMLIRRP